MNRVNLALFSRVLIVAAAGIVGAAPALAQTFNSATYYISDFRIERNGSLLFRDTFDGPTLPPAAPNLATGNPTSYILNTGASFVPGDLADGKLRFNPQTQGGLSTNATGLTTSRTQAARLNTNVDPTNFTLGLKSNHTFSVTGTFDLIAPPAGDYAYGIRLQNTDDQVDLRVLGTESGQMAVRFRVQDYINDTVTTLQDIMIDPTGHDSIALRLSYSPSNAVTASFDYLSGGAVVGTNNFSVTAGHFDDLNWTRAGFSALVGVAPVPEPETYAMLLAGLGLLGFVAQRRKQQVA